MGKATDKKVNRLESRIDALMLSLEKARFKEYVEYLGDRKRIFRGAFISGLARGLGTAVGFTVLGALTLYVLQSAAASSLPIIGDFIAKLIKIVENKL